MERTYSRPLYILLAAVLFAVVRPVVAQTETVVFTEAFDGVTAPALPPGWAATGVGWATSTMSASPGSGANNLVHAGQTAGTVTTPAIDLSGLTSGTLAYLARRTGTYAPEQLVVIASTDGGVTFPVTVLAAGAALPAAESVYQEVEAVLPAELLGHAGVVFRFEGAGGSTGGSSMRLDDLTLQGVRPLHVAPAALSFFAQAGGQQDLSFTVTNQSGTDQLVGAPAVTGAAFGVAPAGAVTLPDGAAQVYTVTFAPPADGSFSGTVTLATDLGALGVALTGTTAGGQFGFDTASSAALEEAGAVDVALVLDYAGTVPLQGMEFEVTWDDGVLSFVEVVRGTAVADAGLWRLSAEPAGQGVKVVLLGEGTTGLAAQAYAPLLWLRMASGTVAPQDAQPVNLTLDGLIGAQATPEGDDAGVVPGVAAHAMAVERRRAFFVASTAALDLGTVAVGANAQAQFTVTNTGGTRALSVSGIATTNDRFSVTPATASVAPDAGQTFTVTFAPSAAAFGPQSGQLVVSHDGEAGPDFTLDLTAFGVGGRGDAEADGVVDVLDLVYGIDFVLGRLTATAAQRTATDLHPFPDGNGALDVRDLTVLVQAIAAGRWPDALLLPAEVLPGPSKTGLAEGARFALQQDAEGWLLAFDHVLPLRAAQLVLQVDGLAGGPVVVSDPARPAEAVLAAQGSAATGEVRILLYRPDGGVLAPGRYRIAAIPVSQVVPHVAVRYATAVDADRNRVGVAVDLAIATAAEASPEAPEAFELGAPFPNPFRAGTAQALQVPVALPSAGTVTVEVYDVTGRRVAVLAQYLERGGRAVVVWDGRTPGGRRVGPGLYLLRATAGTGTLSRPVVVLP